MRLLVQNVHKRFGKLEALKGVSLELGAGEILGLLGPNGAGKTTLIKVVLGLLLPDGGEVVLEEGGARRRPQGHEFGVLLEGSRNLYVNLSLLVNALYFGGIRGLPPKEVRPRFEAWLERFGLKDRLHAPLASLSRGMQQKAALALALALKPRFLLLDEPTLGLDPEAAREFLDLIKGLKAEGITVLLSSHLLHQVQEVCDRVGLFHKGRLALEGTVAELAHRVLGGQYEILLEGAPGLEGALEAVEGVSRVEAEGGRYRVLATRDLRPELARLVVERGPLYALSLRQPSLDEIYAHYFKEVAHAA